MDLGCLDLGCTPVMDKHSKETFHDSEKKEGDAEETITVTAKVGKNRTLKETAQSTLNAFNRSMSQIKKPSHRKNSSPLSWFPRKKTDSYLERKIRLLQEVGGMNLTLDETLGASNPHYSRVEREKIAAREAARKAMEARKAAMVEASWCRILQAARIQNKEAESLLMKAEKNVAEAFEAAREMGVILYDRPDCPRKACEVESSSVNKGGSTTHTVTASFETAFEVYKEVAAAVKAAFIRLAHCPSNKDEFRDLLRRMSYNPDVSENTHELSEFSSECESDAGSELDSESQNDGISSQGSNLTMQDAESRQTQCKSWQLPENTNATKLVDMMLDRLKCLQEEELASLATIVATCGLNAALLEVENSKQHDSDSGNMSSFGAGTVKHFNMEHFMDGQTQRKQVVSELPSLDKFLVKHMSRLEKEVQEAKNTRKKETREGSGANPEGSEDAVDLSNRQTLSEDVPGLGSILVKRSSKLEMEIKEAKMKAGNVFEKEYRGLGNMQSAKQEVPELPSLDKSLVKHVSRLEREVQQAKARKNDSRPTDLNKVVVLSDSSFADGKEVGKENRNSNKEIGGLTVKENFDTAQMENENTLTKLQRHDSTEHAKGSLTIRNMSRIERAKLEALDAFSFPDENGRGETVNSLDSILVKPVHRLEREKLQALAMGKSYETMRDQKKQGRGEITVCESLDQVLVKHVSRLEKEKMEFSKKGEILNVRRRDPLVENSGGSLDQILVKLQSRLEKEKLVAAQQSDQIKHPLARREARERELQETWGGLSLGNSVRPHLSRLERDKAAWIKAEEEERREARREL